MNINQDVAGFLTPFADETIALTAGAVGLTAANLTPSSTQTQRDLGKCRVVFITVEGNVRYTVTGTTPVGGTTGHLLSDGSSLTLANRQSMLNALFIKDTSNAKLQITYLR